MDDLISRQAAKEAVRMVVKDLPTRTEINILINDLPSAEPERKTGEWYKPVGMMPPEYAGVYRCSKCGEIAMRDWKHHKQVLSNFCPNCGADMREGQDGER